MVVLKIWMARFHCGSGPNSDYVELGQATAIGLPFVNQRSQRRHWYEFDLYFVSCGWNHSVDWKINGGMIMNERYINHNPVVMFNKWQNATTKTKTTKLPTMLSQTSFTFVAKKMHLTSRRRQPTIPIQPVFGARLWHVWTNPSGHVS